MNQKSTIQIKATFLLVVFSLNIIIGFGCAIGLDMSFDFSNHHNEATEAVVHIHKDGKKHIHHEKKDKHKHGNSNHTESASASSKKSNDDCCNEMVAIFVQLDKSVPVAVSVNHPFFVTSFIAAFYYDDLIHHENITKDIKYFVRSYHPPIQDIRIAIQSFQI